MLSVKKVTTFWHIFKNIYLLKNTNMHMFYTYF
jgi:hypothetical protein